MSSLKETFGSSTIGSSTTAGFFRRAPVSGRQAAVSWVGRDIGCSCGVLSDVAFVARSFAMKIAARKRLMAKIGIEKTRGLPGYVNAPQMNQSQ